jgi:NADPH:quinone reductase-like Zn-dependent oxidoreductase
MLRHLAPEPKKIVNCLNLTNAGVDFLCGFFSLPNDGTLAEYVAVEARNVAPLPGDVDFTGARACQSRADWWQGLFEHGRLMRGRASSCTTRPAQSGR